MSAETVYKSANEDVLAAWHDTQQRHADWHAEVGQYSARFPDHKVLQTSWGSTIEVVGLVGEESPGAGWRQADRAGHRCWVPDKRTKVGKALHAEIEALTLKKLGVLPGMPPRIFGAGHVYSHSVDLWDGIVWVGWSCTADLIEDIDLTRWMPARLSEYYAEKERHSDGRVHSLDGHGDCRYCGEHEPAEGSRCAAPVGGPE